jgi:hypothetical protein
MYDVAPVDEDFHAVHVVLITQGKTLCRASLLAAAAAVHAGPERVTVLYCRHACSAAMWSD